MTSLPNYLSEVYSEELFAGISEADYNDVMQASAADDGWQGYEEWSQELEQGEIVKTEHGPILINRDCSHTSCKTSRCERGRSYEGIAI